MPHFTIKRLLLSTTLIALGLGAFAVRHDSDWWWLCIYSLPFICAGLCAPFYRTWQGFGVGCLIYVLLAIVVVVWLFIAGPI